MKPCRALKSYKIQQYHAYYIVVSIKKKQKTKNLHQFDVLMDEEMYSSHHDDELD